MLYAAKSHVGLVRSMNQDGYIIVPTLPFGHFYLVADGMGGPSAGDIASQLAVHHVSSYLKDYRGANDENAGDILLAAIHHANEVIYREAEANPDYHGMGTTVVCALASESHIHFAHVGDSRAYFFSRNELRQVTKDHSLVAELVRRGQLTAQEAKIHPQRNIVTRSLGTELHSTPDLDTVPWSLGDGLLLCSDGLTNLVSDAELTTFLERASGCDTQGELLAVVDDMITLALERGGSDNVTALLAVHREEREVH